MEDRWGELISFWAAFDCARLLFGLVGIGSERSIYIGGRFVIAPISALDDWRTDRGQSQRLRTSSHPSTALLNHTDDQTKPPSHIQKKYTSRMLPQPSHAHMAM